MPGSEELRVAAELLDQAGPPVAACRAWRDCGSVLAYLVGDLHAGLNFRSWDSGDLAVQLARMLLDDTLYQSLRENARTIAGRFGARWSRLYRDGFLGRSHYNVELSNEERRRITLWLDANSLEMPTFSLDKKIQAKARRGELVWPILDVDPANPQGHE